MSNKKPLKLVFPKQAPESVKIEVGFALQGETLIVSFDTHSARSNVNPSLAIDSSQWGLWDWDVVEVFVSADASSQTYYEFQLSPLGQFFELEIFEPRKKINRDFKSGFQHSVTAVSPTHWKAEMQIPLKALHWDGKPESIRGNAFAVLGENEKKTYWSLGLPRQDKPDFHLPQHFQALCSLL